MQGEYDLGKKENVHGDRGKGTEKKGKRQHLKIIII